MKRSLDYIEPTDKYKVGSLVQYPMSKAVEEGLRESMLCLVVEIREGYYRLQCIRTRRHYNTTEQWLALPTYYPTPMGLPKNARTVIKGS